MFNNWVFRQNAKTVLWLNKSYLTKGNRPTFIWFLYPIVLVHIIFRLFLMGTKVIVSIANKLFLRNKEETSQVIVDNKIQTLENLDQKMKRSFLDILLFRNIFENESEDNFLPDEVPDLTKLINHPLSFKTESAPKVSVIIPVYNKIEYTYNCLLSLQSHLPANITTEIIVIDDCSSDETQKILSAVKGLKYLRNEKNSGFLLNCQKASELAAGEYLCFLNNDTLIRPFWLESLLDVLENDPTTGITGSKLIYPNGKLQEAGGVILPYTGADNFGHNGNPFDPQYNFLRETDYVSGASLLISKENFKQVNGFDKLFLPAYYEDTDLCFKIKHELGLKVVYVPKSEVIHYEGISSGKNFSQTNVKKNQLINQTKFEEKWKHVLQTPFFLKANNNKYKAARKYCGKETILVIDSYMPRYDKESGSNRLLHILKILKKLGYHVIFMPDNWSKEEPYTSILQQLGIETLYSTNLFNTDLVSQLEDKLPYVNAAWLCRPDIAEKYSEALLKHNNKIKLIYDTIDLHYLRLKREAELYPDQVSDKENWNKMKAIELKLSHMANKVVAITDVDKQHLIDENIAPDKIVTIPNVHVFEGRNKPGFQDRNGLLFIGSYNHPPNIDAVIWLCREVMPKVWESYPDLKVTLLGNNPPGEVLALANDRIIVPGFVQNVSPYFNSHRIFVAPLRYGAGMKGKIGQSYEFGLPIISTTIGVEGMGLKDGYNVLVADDSESFAEKILLLNSDSRKWELLSGNSEAAISCFSPGTIQKEVLKMLSTL